MLNLYLALVIAHILADFPLQVGFIYDWKIRSNWGLALHIAVHTGVMLVLFRSPQSWWPGLIALGAVHFFIDWVKLRYPIRPQILGFATDQFWHALSLIPLVLIYPKMQSRIPERFLLPDLGLALLSPLFLSFWTYSWDLKNQPHDQGASPLVTWGSKNLLRISQIIGFAVVVVVIAQAWI